MADFGRPATRILPADALTAVSGSSTATLHSARSAADLWLDVSRIDRPPRFASRQPHRPDFFEVLLITRGEGRMTIGSESFRLQPGSLVFAAADEVLTLELAPKTERFVLCIKEGFLAASSDPFLLRRLCLFGRSGGPRSVRLGPSDRGWISERLSSMQAELGRLEAQSRTILAAQLVETL